MSLFLGKRTEFRSRGNEILLAAGEVGVGIKERRWRDGVIPTSEAFLYPNVCIHAADLQRNAGELQFIF